MKANLEVDTACLHTRSIPGITQTYTVISVANGCISHAHSAWRDKEKRGCPPEREGNDKRW